MANHIAAAQPETAWPTQPRRWTRLHVYVGFGQVVDFRENERCGWEHAMARATAESNEEAIRELTAIAPYPPEEGLMPPEALYTQRKWIEHYGGAMHNREGYASQIAGIALSPESRLGPAYEAASHTRICAVRRRVRHCVGIPQRSRVVAVSGQRQCSGLRRSRCPRSWLERTITVRGRFMKDYMDANRIDLQACAQEGAERLRLGDRGERGGGGRGERALERGRRIEVRARRREWRTERPPRSWSARVARSRSGLAPR